MPIDTLHALYPAEAFDTDSRLLELARLAEALANGQPGALEESTGA